MKFTTIILSALAAVTAVAAVPVQYDDSIVFARSDDGELFVRFEDVVAMLEARGSGSSKVKNRSSSTGARTASSRPPSYASNPPLPDYQPGPRPPRYPSTHPTEFLSTPATHSERPLSNKTPTGHNR